MKTKSKWTAGILLVVLALFWGFVGIWSDYGDAIWYLALVFSLLFGMYIAISGWTKYYKQNKKLPREAMIVIVTMVIFILVVLWGNLF